MTVDTSLGFEVCDFADQVLEIDLYPWQRWLFIHGLELNPDGTFRFRKVLVLVARQNGKTTALMALSLWRLVMDQAEMVLGTSTNLDYARESWQKAVGFAWGPRGAKTFQGVPQLEGEFIEPRYANGEQELTTFGGGRYKIGTATRTGGRSLSVDLLILDEIREHKTWDAWSASSKTTNAKPRGQVWALSNAGDDTSIVLNHLREKALKGSDEDGSLAIFEWSAPDGCDTKDRAAWAQANPALGYGISEATIASDEEDDPEPVFRTEVLCQHVPALEPQPIDPGAWAVLGTDVPLTGTPHFFIDCSPDLRSASIAGAVMLNGQPHVGMADYRPGTHWVMAKVLELKRAYPEARWQFEGSGPASALVEQFEAAKLRIEKPFSGTEMARGCVHLQKLVANRAMSHSGDADVAAALKNAIKRDIGDPGLWAWGRRKSSGDISPLVACTGALWLLETTRKSGVAIY